MSTQAVPVGGDAPILEVMATMRAMRRLHPEPIPRETLTQLVEAATWAPSGGNSQDYAFVVIDDPDQVAALATIWRRIVDYYVATQGAPDHMSPEAWDRMLATLRYQAEHFEQVPALIVACYSVRPTLTRMARNWRAVLQATVALGPRRGLRLLLNTPRFIRRGEAACIYPAVENLLLAARALGLGAVMTTWHTWFEQEVKDVLGIPASMNTYAIVPVGRPKGRLGPVVRRPAQEAIRWNRW